MTSRAPFAVLSSFAFLFVAACGEAAPPPAAAAPTPLAESHWLAAEPAGGVAVLAAKQVAKHGDEVTVVGRVGGDVRTFSDMVAVFTIVDPALKPCGEAGHEDGCTTPWDYCCEDKTGLRAATATVEFRDGDRVRKATVRGFHGLDHLKTVVVKGRAERDAAGNLVVVATGVHVRP